MPLARVTSRRERASMFQDVRVNDCLCGVVGSTGLQCRVGWLKTDVPLLSLVAIAIEC